MSNLRSNIEDSDDDDEPTFTQFKIILLGDGTVGKTSLCMKICGADFPAKYKQTIGVDFFSKRLELPNNVHISVQLWDVGGQSIGGRMLSTYILGANAILLVYDLTNYQSFVNLEEWLQVVKDTFAGQELPYIALIGNKTDLFHMQAVKMDKHSKFADENQLYSYMLSAKTGDQVYNTIFRISADLAGVVLTAQDIEASQQILRPEVLNYSNAPQQEAPAAHPAPAHNQAPAPAPAQATRANPPPPPPKKKKRCVIF